MIRAYYSPVRRHFRTSLEGPDRGSARSQLHSATGVQEHFAKEPREKGL